MPRQLQAAFFNDMKTNLVRRALLAVVLFTLLFALLMVAAAYFWTHDSARIAIVCFIAAFMSMLCQNGSILLFARHKQRQVLMQQQRKNNDVQ